MLFSRLWRPSRTRSHHNYRGLGSAMCVFYAFGGYRQAKNHYNCRGLGGAVCVFHVFGGYRPTKTTIIIGSGGRDVRISRVWRVSTSQDHYNFRGLFSVFFRGAENGPGSASNGRFGPPFWRLKGGGHTKGENRADPASTPARWIFSVFQGCRKWPREGLKRAF